MSLRKQLSNLGYYWEHIAPCWALSTAHNIRLYNILGVDIIGPLDVGRKALTFTAVFFSQTPMLVHHAAAAHQMYTTGSVVEYTRYLYAAFSHPASNFTGGGARSVKFGLDLRDHSSLSGALFETKQHIGTKVSNLVQRSWSSVLSKFGIVWSTSRDRLSEFKLGTGDVLKRIGTTRRRAASSCNAFAIATFSSFSFFLATHYSQ